MSFSKAKIIRFNEIEGCAPPPGSYTPKLEPKLVGGVLSKTQRFVDGTEEHVGINAHNLSRCSSKSSTDDVSKTPKTPNKFFRPPPRSLSKPKKVSSLQDLSTVGNAGELQKLEEEVHNLRKEIEIAMTVKSRLIQLQTVTDHSVYKETMQEVVKEWNTLSVSKEQFGINSSDIQAQLKETQRQLAEAELKVESLSDKLGNAETNLAAMQDLFDQSEHAYRQLQSDTALKIDNFERIIAELQVHLKVCEEDKMSFQHKMLNAESTVNDLKTELCSTKDDLVSSENARMTLQEQLLQKCDLLEEFIVNQEKLQTDLQQSFQQFNEAQTTLAKYQEYEEEMASKYAALQEDNNQATHIIRDLQLKLAEADQIKATDERTKEEINNKLQAHVNTIVLLQKELEKCQEVLKYKDDDLNAMSLSLVTEEQAKNHVLIEMKDLAAKYAILEDKMTDKINRLSSLEEELASANEKKSVLQMNLVSVESNIVIMKEKLQASEETCEINNQLVRESETIITSLRAELTANVTRKENFENDLKNNLDKISELQKELGDSEVMKMQLQKELVDEKTNFSQLENQYRSAQCEMQSLEARLKEQALKIKILTGNKEQFTQQMESLSYTCLSLKENIKTFQLELEEANLTIATLILQNEESRVEKHELQHKMNIERIIMKETEAYVEQMVKDCDERYNSKLQGIIDLNKKLGTDLIQSLNKENSYLEELCQIKINLKTILLRENKQLDTIHQLKENLAEIKHGYDMGKRRIETLNADLDKKELQVANLQEKLNIMGKNNDKLQRKLTGTKNVNKNTQEKLKNYEETISLLQQDLEESKTEKKKLEKSLKENEIKVLCLETKISEAENEIVASKELLECYKKEKEDIMGNFNNEIQEKEIAEAKLNEFANEFKKQLEENLQAFEQRLKILQESLNATEIQRNEFEAKYSDSQNNMSILQKELMHAKEHLQEHMNEANKNIVMLQEQLHLALQHTTRLEEERNKTSEFAEDMKNKLLICETAKADAEFELETANHLIDCLYETSNILLTKLTETNDDCNDVINAIDQKVELLVQENLDIQENYEMANEKIYQLNIQLSGVIDAKLKVEDEIHGLRTNFSMTQDKLFDAQQEMEDLTLNFNRINKMIVVLEEEKKCLEAEYAKAEKEWDQREQELQCSWKLLSDEVKMSEEKQIQLEARIIDLENREADLLSETKIMKDDVIWSENQQLELEGALNKLLTEKEHLIEELQENAKKIEIYAANNKLATAGMEACKNEVLKVSDMLTILRQELTILKQDFNDQDDEITLLEDQLAEKQCEIEHLKQLVGLQEQEQNETAKLKENLKDVELEVTQLRREQERRCQLADEMEELLQCKLEELSQVREHLNKLETHVQELNTQIVMLTEAEQLAQEEKRAAERQSTQATKALATAKEEFSQKWSLMEDSILNLETVETRNRELSTNEASLRSQLKLLDDEASRLRNDNRELRARLAHLERNEARSGGHQNPAQKISYMQHLKEIILKQQQSEEELHERLVASDCRVAELEAELQKKSGSTALLGKSILQHTTASIAKKTPRCRGKENDRSLLTAMSISRSTSSLVTSTPLQPKVLSQKNQ